MYATRYYVIESFKISFLYSRNFRENLKRFTAPGRNIQAHHWSQKEFADRFAEKKLFVNDPKYGVWMESTVHREIHGKHQYNLKFFEYLEANPTATLEGIHEFGRHMMEQHSKKVKF